MKISKKWTELESALAHCQKDSISWPWRPRNFGRLPAAVLSTLVLLMSVFFWRSRIGHKHFPLLFNVYKVYQSCFLLTNGNSKWLWYDIWSSHIPITVLWKVTSYSLVDKHKRFGGICCLHLHVGESSSRKFWYLSTRLLYGVTSQNTTFSWLSITSLLGFV